MGFSFRVNGARHFRIKVACQSGQAVAEYILVLLVAVILILTFLWLFSGAFKAWANNYFGDYLTCILETGELPNISGEPGDSGQCDQFFEPFSLKNGRPLILNAGGGGGNNNQNAPGPIATRKPSAAELAAVGPAMATAGAGSRPMRRRAGPTGRAPGAAAREERRTPATCRFHQPADTRPAILKTRWTEAVLSRGASMAASKKMMNPNAVTPRAPTAHSKIPEPRN